MSKKVRLDKATRIAANVGEVHTWQNGEKRKKMPDGTWAIVTEPRDKKTAPDTKGVPNKIQAPAPSAKAANKIPVPNKEKKQEQSGGRSAAPVEAKAPKSIQAGSFPWSKGLAKVGALDSPPADAKDVKVRSDGDPNTAPVATWKDKNGNEFAAYTTGFVKRYKADQWNRLRQNADALDKAPDKLHGVLSDERRPYKERDAAAISLLTMMTGYGAGTSGGAGDGLATLQSSNVTVGEDKTSAQIDYADREGIRKNGTVADEELALYLVEKLETADQRSGFMFDYDEAVLNAVMGEAGIGALSLADLAAATNANSVADILSGTPVPHDFGGSPQSTFGAILTNIENIRPRGQTATAPQNTSHVPPNVMAQWALENGLDAKVAGDIRKAGEGDTGPVAHFSDLFKSALQMGGMYAVPAAADYQLHPADEMNPVGSLLCYPIPDVILNNAGLADTPDSNDPIADMGKALPLIFDLVKGAQPPPGYQPTPSGHGYRKRVGDHWDYWYPSSGHAGAAAEHHEGQAKAMRKKLERVLRSRGAKQEDIEKFLHKWVGHENAAHTFKRHASAMKDAEVVAPDIAGKISSRPSNKPDGGGTLSRTDRQESKPTPSDVNIPLAYEADAVHDVTEDMITGEEHNVTEDMIIGEEHNVTEDMIIGEEVVGAAQQQAAEAANRAAQAGQQGAEGPKTASEISGISPETIDSPNPEEAAKTQAEYARVQAAARKTVASMTRRDNLMRRLAIRSGVGTPEVPEGISFDDFMKSPAFEEYVRDAKHTGVNREQVKEIFAAAHYNEVSKMREDVAGMQYHLIQSQVRDILGENSSWKSHAQQYGASFNTPQFKAWSKKQMADGMSLAEAKTKWRGYIDIALEEPSALLSGLINERLYDMVSGEDGVFGAKEATLSVEPPKPVSQRFEPGNAGGGSGPPPTKEAVAQATREVMENARREARRKEQDARQLPKGVDPEAARRIERQAEQDARERPKGLPDKIPQPQKNTTGGEKPTAPSKEKDDGFSDVPPPPPPPPDPDWDEKNESYAEYTARKNREKAEELPPPPPPVDEDALAALAETARERKESKSPPGGEAKPNVPDKIPMKEKKDKSGLTRIPNKTGSRERVKDSKGTIGVFSKKAPTKKKGK